MNREYLLMRIGLGDTTAEANNIVLSPEDKKAIESGIRLKLRRQEEKVEVLSFMHLMMIDCDEIRHTFKLV